ncbi:alanyl-tRNA editing protein [Peribacillus sp. SCS-155]|uniref:alanyl-tRNA editing protein n=1 Tax=Peribacillus sedimenti TaxID=3115297 RepID=UPI003906CC96
MNILDKLYYTDPYLSRWETDIKEILHKEDHYLVILKETAFFPEGGGQPADSGSIDGIPVLDVFEDNGTIYHKIDSLPADTEQIACEIDWKRRFDHMQQHSGQHLLSAVFRELYDAGTVSFHLGTDYVSIDVQASDLAEQQLHMAEHLANQYIYDNRRIIPYFVTAEELREIPVVKQPKVTEHIRIVEMEGIEFNPCGGTHVTSTGSIGLIKLLKSEKQKNHTRFYFLCGFRAMADYHESQEILAVLSKKFSVGKSGILDRISKWEEEQKQLERESERLQEENSLLLAKTLIKDSDFGVLFKQFDHKSLKDLQKLATAVINDTELLVVFASLPENKVLISHNGKIGFHCGQFLKEHINSYNGRGGGSEKSAQAGFPSRSDLLSFYDFCQTSIREYIKSK